MTRWKDAKDKTKVKKIAETSKIRSKALTKIYKEKMWNYSINAQVRIRMD